MFPLLFSNHTRFTVLKTRAAWTVRERSRITVILSLRTKWKSQSGFVENQYNRPSVLRNTTNVGFYLETRYYFWIRLKPSGSEEESFFTLHAWPHRLIVDNLTGNATISGNDFFYSIFLLSLVKASLSQGLTLALITCTASAARLFLRYLKHLIFCMSCWIFELV